MTRTDIHCPSKINPQDYQFVAFEFVKIENGDIGACMFLQEQRRIIQEHMSRTKGTYAHVETTGNCMVCGNTLAIYTVLFYHADTNTYVRMGDICAQKVECAFDNSAFNRFKDTVNGARKAVAVKNKAMVTLMDLGYGNAWDLFEVRAEQWQNFKYEETTICDIVGKLVKYGSISEPQTKFVGRLLTQINTRDERLAARRAKEEAAAPVPETEERIKIVGKVVHTFYDSESMFPGPRMIVETVDGWVVTGTQPADIVKGQQIQFMARVVVSKNNTKKGYFKRPTQVEVLTAELATV